jgi:2-hydroxy-3-keto-5-methylthiopentenyl-1-phosphate phosphatase
MFRRLCSSVSVRMRAIPIYRPKYVGRPTPIFIRARLTTDAKAPAHHANITKIPKEIWTEFGEREVRFDEVRKEFVQLLMGTKGSWLRLSSGFNKQIAQAQLLLELALRDQYQANESSASAEKTKADDVLRDFITHSKQFEVTVSELVEAVRSEPNHIMTGPETSILERASVATYSRVIGNQFSDLETRLVEVENQFKQLLLRTDGTWVRVC